LATFFATAFFAAGCFGAAALATFFTGAAGLAFFAGTAALLRDDAAFAAFDTGFATGFFAALPAFCLMLFAIPKPIL
jgi:hypothetical protein